jgi:C4-dicarboxylate-specific signal transduction histidine kinase
MKPYHNINAFLERITFSGKTRLLIIIIAGGMMSIGFLMFISIFALKYDYETLFQRRTMPLVGLEEIKDLYAVNIHDTLYDLQAGQISLANATEVIVLAKQIVDEQWANYHASLNHKVSGIARFASAWLNFFLFVKDPPPKSLYQEGITSKVQVKMDAINERTLEVLHLRETKQRMLADQVTTETFLEINALSIYISSLITSHLKEAISEKIRTERIFQTSIFMLILLIGFVFSLSILVSILLINHFKNLNASLEAKVDDKTKALQHLNSSLEKRVAKEVELNRKKDQIMFQQSRMASLGEMLQNIAHQWRQPLGALTMIIQSFETKHMSGKLTGAFIEERVKDAQVLAKGMSETLDDFRTFFNPNKSKRAFDLEESIQKAIDLSYYLLEKEGVELELFNQENIRIFGFKNELSHVFLNLINNAKDALEGKESPKKIHIYVKSTPADYQISIIDNAGGVNEKILPRIFDPYFTTKHQSVGTGIGLYMSKQIVEEHMQGSITCKNIYHKMGTKKLYRCAMFTIHIPRHQKDSHEPS